MRVVFSCETSWGVLGFWAVGLEGRLEEILGLCSMIEELLSARCARCSTQKDNMTMLRIEPNSPLPIVTDEGLRGCADPLHHIAEAIQQICMANVNTVFGPLDICTLAQTENTESHRTKK